MNGYENIIDGDENTSLVLGLKSQGRVASFINGAYTGPLLHGQVISMLISGTGIFASLLSSRDSNCPMLLNAFNYLLLSFYLVWKWMHNDLKLHLPWWCYVFVAILDVEANVLVVTAYNYTSITSIMLLDCFSIPCVMFLSIVFLKTKYSVMHIVGVVVCLLGMSCIVLSDAIVDKDSDDNRGQPLKGDILCLMGTCLYACSNVLQETMVKDKDPKEFLGMLGLNGTIIAIVQMFVFEFSKVKSVEWSSETIGFAGGYVICLFCMYTATSLFLKTSDAALFNLSLLTSDVYAVVFAYLMFGSQVHWLYYIAFSLTASGLVVYSTAGPVSSSIKDTAEGLRRNMFSGEKRPHEVTTDGCLSY